MKKFNLLDGLVAPLDRANVDTDAIIPKQFLKSILRTGFGPNLFDEWRYLDHGEPGQDSSRRPLNPDFVLNQPRYQGATILLTRKNFGCGSSREAGVYVLVDQGITCVIAPSFGDIFASNSIKNGLLPARLSESEIEELLAEPTVIDGRPIRVDLANQKIIAGNRSFDFEIRADWKKQLINGWDDIDMTRSYAKDIEAFVAEDAGARPWAVPGAPR
jgi:3-isopropylmalate/(R)-2-methylmalate dehydratase small subunit